MERGVDKGIKVRELMVGKEGKIIDGTGNGGGGDRDGGWKGRETESEKYEKWWLWFLRVSGSKIEGGREGWSGVLEAVEYGDVSGSEVLSCQPPHKYINIQIFRWNIIGIYQIGSV